MGYLGVSKFTEQSDLKYGHHVCRHNRADFDCQNRVAAALEIERLATAGYLTAEESRNGIDGMVDATMEATEEPE
jgi:hypothetical protein